ncbi:DUF3263 domain-containing protein [Nocardia aobensis]|uniref:DUF3263 domain-containing protein n=1 Tax=Nocardia aobensis TaxID=257277 RepID=UPI0002DF0DAE|nr:DUF3263 domain-containing protein [Nocardia aobensis]
MTPFDIEMLEFATAWAPYGGNDEEAFIRFGLRPKEFHVRLLRLLRTPPARVLGGSTLSALREQCRERLARSAVQTSR